MKPYIWTEKRQQRAEAEGWGIFDSGRGTEVQRIDSPDDGRDPLPDDDAAVTLARKMGVPVNKRGEVTRPIVHRRNPRRRE